MKNITQRMTFVISIIGSLLFNTQVFAQQVFTITGQLGANKQGKIFLQYKNNSRNYFDSSAVTNGKFAFQGEIIDPQYATLMLNPPHNAEEAKRGFDSHDIFLEAGKITVKSDSTLKAASVDGGPGQKELNKYFVNITPILNRYQVVRVKLSELRESKESPEYKQYETEYKDINLKVRAMDSTYAAQNRDSYFGFFLWSKYFRKPDDNTLADLNRFSKRIRETQSAKLVANKVETAKRLAPGKPAPDFTLADSSGKQVALSSFKGKNVMLLFWFSNFMGFDQFAFNIGRINRRLHDKNFIMVSVYYNYDKRQHGTEDWKQVISSEFINTVNLEDAEGINGAKLSPTAKAYGILPSGVLPLGLLIGPDGNIIENRINLFDAQVALSLEKKLK
ncbi:DUF4369 domain-containing protein [Mucilaginibacter rubeus]|uniref:DUF4369 domain-containing protein n=1 Tax=Mucilaginibacter rubeus TaxID=2027860 RepID=A0A5C1I1L9_9SPHI|nr:DUF4369 domain-containing protein [Mucilaginibacter rubeus]QEM11744.1 DUF4369 domain-containing protein [Mucilaginibacter rubeus]